MATSSPFATLRPVVERAGLVARAVDAVDVDDVDAALAQALDRARARARASRRSSRRAPGSRAGRAGSRSRATASSSRAATVASLKSGSWMVTSGRSLVARSAACLLRRRDACAGAARRGTPGAAGGGRTRSGRGGRRSRGRRGRRGASDARWRNIRRPPELSCTCNSLHSCVARCANLTRDQGAPGATARAQGARTPGFRFRLPSRPCALVAPIPDTSERHPPGSIHPALLCASLVLASSCVMDQAPHGAARARPSGPGATVRFDLAHQPLPDIPLPNDVGDLARSDEPHRPPAQREPRRADHVRAAGARSASTSSRGGGRSRRSRVSFDLPSDASYADYSGPALDLANLAKRHQGDDYDFADDAIYLVNLTTGVPVPLDIGRGQLRLHAEEARRSTGRTTRASPSGTSSSRRSTRARAARSPPATFGPADDTDFDGVARPPEPRRPLGLPGPEPGLRRRDEPDVRRRRLPRDAPRARSLHRRPPARPGTSARPTR